MLKTDYRFGEVHTLRDKFAQAGDKVAFSHVFSNSNGGVVLLTFAPGQELAEHLSPAEVMVYVVEGSIDFSMLNDTMRMEAGQFLMMGKGVPHRVLSMEGAKVMLIKVAAEE